jgi:hypothetical protein
VRLYRRQQVEALTASASCFLTVQVYLVFMNVSNINNLLSMYWDLFLFTELNFVTAQKSRRRE